MTAQEQLTIRALLVCNESNDANSHSAFRLLNELGHDVSTADSANQALELLGEGRADLVIVDSDRSSQHDFVTGLASLPLDQQPRQVAIFSEVNDETIRGLAQQIQRSQVHVLLKPLHMHGLLSVLRHLDARPA